MPGGPKRQPSGTPATTPAQLVPDRHLLFVDDIDEHRSVLAREMRGLGWIVDEATDAGMAMRIARERPPTIIITELLLPDMPGFRLARLLRTIVEPSVLLLALTRVEDSGIHALARMGGIGDVLTKPIAGRQLHDQLVGVLQARQNIFIA